MGKKSKLKSKIKHDYSEDDEQFLRKNQFLYSDDDDDEADEDLSLKIVEKAMSRASNMNNNVVVVDGTLRFEGGEFGVLESGKKKKKVKKVKKKKVKNVESDIMLVTPTKEETKVDATEDVEVVNLPESDDGNNTSDNTVLRRLLRGPRYFDPPDKSWGACYNCGEEGHSAVNCTSARRKRPCFICGSLEHEVKQCQKGQDCFICKGGGHRAKDCPKKFKHSSQASELCLKCGNIAHVMHTCNKDYSPDDLKEIQCYVCKRFGHLCCVDYIDALSSEVSCYKCGQSGHNGPECRGSRGETSARGTPTSSCHKCGEEGHFVRDCTNSSKTKKRTHDSSTPMKKHSREKKANKGYNSAPRDFDNKTRKKFQYDNGSPKWSSKPKRRGGWIPDESYDLHPINGWRSPATPNKKHKPYGSASSGQGSRSRSPKRWNKYGSGASGSRSYANGYQHKFSASRLGNSSTDGMRRHYDWW